MALIAKAVQEARVMAKEEVDKMEEERSRKLREEEVKVALNFLVDHLQDAAETEEEK